MSPFRSANPRSAASAYAQIGLESGVQSADPHLLIGMLFDGALEAISLARKAIQERSYEAKSKAITRALRIVDQGLRSSLNMNSQPMADDLCALYSFVIDQLGHANLKNDDAALQNCSRVLKPLRDAWSDIRGSVVTGPSA
ncbi:flagellar export chaperone FliS [Piscinibacter sakaiensis]|nr:flagellar export chaperone FliS [Piscinibacter sakaiensis]